MRQKVIFEIDDINSDCDGCDVYNPKTGAYYGFYVFDGLGKDLPDLLYKEENETLETISDPILIPNDRQNKVWAIAFLRREDFSFEQIKEMIEKGWV